MSQKDPKVVVMGGGTGSYTLLKALKNYTSNLTALVNMADDGGSTGVLRDELGVLPPGDVRQCLVALSEAPEELSQLFTFRFPKGTFHGHSFGNIFLSAVESMTDNFNDAIRMAGEVLQIRGEVLPITLDECRLVMECSGRQVKGQYEIRSSKLPAGSQPRLYFEPRASITAEAAKAVDESDLVVIAPGDLYASLAPVLLIDGVAQALLNSSAPKVFVCNLVNKPNHTDNFTVHDYASELMRFASADFLDYVLYNTDLPSETLLKKYALEGEFPVVIDEAALQHASYQPVAGNFLSRERQSRDQSDKFIKRSLIRHDGEAVAQKLLELINK